MSLPNPSVNRDKRIPNLKKRIRALENKAKPLRGKHAVRLISYKIELKGLLDEQRAK